MTNLPDTLANTIDKDTPIPYHYQLREWLRDEIVAGRWSVNDRLPSERELCDAFDVSRTTVREAIDSLVAEGMLRREKGRGTFVAAPKVVESLLRSPFSDSMAEQGIPVQTKVLRMEVTTPPFDVARELRLTSADSAIMIERLRSIFDQPILISDSYVPQKLCPTLIHDDLTHNSLYDLLQNKYGFTIANTKRYVEAVAANKMEAELLQVKTGSPLLLIESTVYTEDGTPLEYFKSRRRGDRTRLLLGSYTPLVPGNDGKDDLL